MGWDEDTVLHLSQHRQGPVQRIVTYKQPPPRRLRVNKGEAPSDTRYMVQHVPEYNTAMWWRGK